MNNSAKLLRHIVATLVVFHLTLPVEAKAGDDSGDGNAGRAKQPNIVILIADDLGYGELGCQGNPQIPTPHIDALAAGGIRLTSGYVTASYCSASRAGLLTGRYQTRFGYEFNPIGANNEHPQAGLPGDQLTMAEALHDLGYSTGLIGKWHLGGHANFHPHRHGFDEFFGFTHEGHYFVPPPYRDVITMLRRKSLPGGKRGRFRDGNLIYSTHMGHDEPAYDANNPIVRGGQPVEETDYLTDAFTREAVDFIDRNQSRPFFMVVAYNAVHSPLQARLDDLERVSHIDDIHRRIFAAMLVRMDDSVGRITAKLSELDLEKDTLVVFLSDNGGPTRELTSSNLPLRGGKGSLYEGGIRVPFLLSWPGTIAGGQEYDPPVTSLDLMRTAIVLGDPAEEGSSLPYQERLDGVNLMPYLTGQATAAPRDEVYWRMGRQAAFRQGDWKIVRPRANGGRTNPWELYNLASDLSEQNNLAEDHPERLKALVTRWAEINGQMIDPIWQP